MTCAASSNCAVWALPPCSGPLLVTHVLSNMHLSSTSLSEQTGYALVLWWLFGKSHCQSSWFHALLSGLIPSPLLSQFHFSLSVHASLVLVHGALWLALLKHSKNLKVLSDSLANFIYFTLLVLLIQRLWGLSSTNLFVWCPDLMSKSHIIFLSRIIDLLRSFSLSTKFVNLLLSTIFICIYIYVFRSYLH